MHRLLHKKGFTLVEMLLVIAIIAILVAVIMPVATAALGRAKAAADAANMRILWEELNTRLLDESFEAASAFSAMQSYESQLIPGAVMVVMYDKPGFMDVYYYDAESGTYYSREYFSEYASSGESDKAVTVNPYPTSHWYTVGQPFEGDGHIE